MPVPVYGLFAVIAFALIVMLGLSIVKAIKNRLISRALQKFIIPELNKRGLTYSHYKYLKSFIESGRITPFISMRSRPDMTVMLEIFYLDGNVQGRVVTKIEIVALTVSSVSFNG